MRLPLTLEHFLELLNIRDDTEGVEIIFMRALTLTHLLKCGERHKLTIRTKLCDACLHGHNCLSCGGLKLFDASCKLGFGWLLALLVANEM